MKRCAIRALHGLATAWLLGVAVSTAHAEWQSFLSSQSGLADSRVLCAAEDSAGAMFFGTFQGLSRFDGIQWTTIVDPLPNPNVRAVLEDRAGNLWVGTGAGVARFDGSRWSFFAGDRYLPRDVVLSFYEDHRGDVWIATTGGVVQYVPGSGAWITHPVGPQGLVDSTAKQIIEDRSHNLWIATPKGASELDSTRSVWRSFQKTSGALGSDSLFAIAEAADGAIWFGTYQGAYRDSAGSWSEVHFGQGLASETVTSIVLDPRGGLWLGGKNGLSHFDGRVWRRYTKTDGGQDLEEVIRLYVDRCSNLWVATFSHGLFRFDGIEWRNFTSPTPAIDCVTPLSTSVPSATTLNESHVEAMFEDHLGELWFATFDRLSGTGSLRRYTRTGTWPSSGSYTRTAAVPLSDSIRVLFEDHRGAIWCGSFAAGLARLERSGAWSLFSRASGMPGDSVYAVAEDSAGELWVGTATGLGGYDGSGWTPWLQAGADGLGYRVDRIVEDPHHNLWIKSSRGLYSLDPSRTTLARVSIADGLTDSVVTVLARGASGRIFVGTPHGLSVLDATGWTRYPTFDASGSDSVAAVEEDHLGGIWVSTSHGVAHQVASGWTVFPPDPGVAPPAIQLHEDRSGTVWAPMTAGGVSRFNGNGVRTITHEGDGLISNQITSVLGDGQGHLWFASACGLTEYEPDRVAPQTLLLSHPGAVLPVGSVHLVFGAAYNEGTDLEFATSWDDAPFEDWSSAATFDRDGIPDGFHTLRVKARDWVHNEDPTPAVFHFEVDATPPDAVLSSPTFGQPVRGTVAIRGTADDPRYDGYRVEVRRTGYSSWTGAGVTLLDTSSTTVHDGTLATWNTTGFAEGLYDVRLAVRDTLGLLGTSQTTVMVDNQPPYADVTAPRRIGENGGDVYSTLGEVHVHFPPGALPAGDSVLIVPADLPAGAMPVAGAWSIAWPGGALRKPATLEMAPGDSITALSGAIVEIRRLADDGSWALVGGTRDAVTGHYSALVTLPGSYALVRDAGGPGGVALSEVSASPRALSLSGGYGGAGISIGFTLGRAGPATLRVYNRAGHFVRELASGVAMNAGANLVRWDGRDRDGRLVREGLYLVSVEALGEVRTRPVAVVP